MSEIQIQFPVPGQWQMFSMTAVFQDDAGYSRSDRYKSGEIPAEQLIALQAVIEALVGLKEEWQAVQVWARLDWRFSDAVDEDGEAEVEEVIVLTVEARNDAGGRRILTENDYSAFVIRDPGSVSFFQFFTND